MKKIGAQVTKKQNEFDQIMIALKNNSSLSKSELLSKKLTDEPKLAYQYLHWQVSKLPNGQLPIFVTLLLEKKEIAAVPLLLLLLPPLPSPPPSPPPLAPLLLPSPKREKQLSDPLKIGAKPPIHCLIIQNNKKELGCVEIVWWCGALR